MANKVKTDTITIGFEEDFSEYTNSLEIAIKNQLKEIKNLKNKLKSASWEITKKQNDLKERLILESRVCDSLEKKVDTLSRICLKQAIVQVSLNKENAQLHSRCKDLERHREQIPVFIFVLLTTFLIYLL